MINAKVPSNQDFVAILCETINGEIGRVGSSEEVTLYPEVGVYNSTIRGSIKSVYGGDYGIVGSIVKGSIGRIKSGLLSAIDDTLIEGNVEKIEGNSSGLLGATVLGYMGSIQGKHVVFQDSVFNLVVGDVKGKTLDFDCPLPNLIITNSMDIEEYNGSANVIIPKNYKSDRKEGFITYKGDFKELVKYARENPKELIGLRCVKWTNHEIEDLAALKDINTHLVSKLGTDDIHFAYLVQQATNPRNEKQLFEAIKKYALARPYIMDESITTGSRQLIAARLLRLRRLGQSDEVIKEQLQKLYTTVKSIEKKLKGSPTFGCEFRVETEAADVFDKGYNGVDAAKLSSELLSIAGNRNIVDSHKERRGNLEIRINPSYAPIIAELVEELFKLRILPKDVPIAYSVCAVGKDVIENGLPLLLVNLYTGMTSYMPTTPSELPFKGVHVYNGATVDQYHGTLTFGQEQLNIFAGVCGKVEDNDHLLKYKSSFDTDIRKRFEKMLMPFLVDDESRIQWSQAIYDAVGLTAYQVAHFKNRIRDAQNVSGIWKVHKDIKIKGSPKIWEGIDRAYKMLNPTVPRVE